jgi:hypothetical protein
MRRVMTAYQRKASSLERLKPPVKVRTVFDGMEGRYLGMDKRGKAWVTIRGRIHKLHPKTLVYPEEIGFDLFNWGV